MVRAPDAPPRGSPADAARDGGSDPEIAGVVLHDRYEIFPDRPLADFSTPRVTAFEARDNRGARGDLIALVAGRMVPPRLDLLDSLRVIDIPWIMRPIRWGAVDWRPDGRRTFAVVYSRPGGGRVVPSPDEPQEPMSDDLLMAGVATPLLSALAEISFRGVTHRGVRPDNLYFKDSSGRHVVLGDAVMAPPGSDQPLMFETIESGMAHPFGRGPGTPADDLYALGVTLLVLMLGRNPVAEMDDQALLTAKIEKGSYAALVGELRIRQTMREALRGLLTDDAERRWNLEDLSLWLDGRRLSPIQTTVSGHARRPIAYDGKEYFSLRALAHGMAGAWTSVRQALDGPDLLHWIRHGMRDPERADAVAAVLASAAGNQTAARGEAADALFAARLCMVLDPEGPLRYKSLSGAIDSLGPLLFALRDEANGLQQFAELLRSDLPGTYVDMRYAGAPAGRALRKVLSRMRRFVSEVRPGRGIERCLYESNPSLPCLSPLVERYYVAEPSDLLPALEAVVGDGEGASLPVDRHIAAFIACHFRRGTEDHVAALAAKESPATMTLGVLRALALMQWRLGPPTLPRLTALMARFVGPVIDTYRSETLRKRLHGGLEQVVKQGQLSELLNFIDDPRVRKRDKHAFSAAAAEYAAAAAEIARLGASEEARARQAELAGRRVAVLVSAMVAVGTLAVLAIINLF